MIMECNQCNAYIDATVVGSFNYFHGGGRGSGRFLLATCSKCQSPIFVWQDNIGNLAEGDIWDAPIKLYPYSEFAITANTPSIIKETYDEAVRCFDAHAYTATAVLCRKTIEAICQYHGINESNLDHSLTKMNAEGVIDDRLYEWSDMLRTSGNEAVHEMGTTVPKQDASDMIEFTSAIIDYLFSYREKFKEFKKRRGKKNVQ